MTYFKMLAIVLFVAGVALVGYKVGDFVVRAEWEKEKRVRAEETINALAARNILINQVKAKNDADTKKLKEGFNAEISSIRAGFASAGRVRFTQGTCKRLASAGEAKSTGGGDGGVAETWVFSDRVDADLKQFGQMIEEKFEACRVAQDFIRNNGMAP